MIIDIPGHYTTEPQAVHVFRDKQLAGLADPARRPASTDLGISDETIRQSVEPQLKLQRERGGDMTIFSPRASGMASSTSMNESPTPRRHGGRTIAEPPGEMEPPASTTGCLALRLSMRSSPGLASSMRTWSFET